VVDSCADKPVGTREVLWCHAARRSAGSFPENFKEEAMSSRDARSEGAGTVDMKLEVVVIPVSDVDRAKEFYEELGWRLDADFAAGDEFRIVQFNPPGSGCSVQFGTNVSSASPGSAESLYLIVSDIASARDELVARGVEVSELFHEEALGGRFHNEGRANGPAPDNQTYGSFASFSDPDGNGWLLQEITTRLPGRVDADTGFATVNDLASALRRAEAAHGEHEKRTGQRDDNWADWYAAYIVAEQAGAELPT
jgi:catechol 2,3-dioxygenase-like lactoylglutathione lyase family enzyme